jgi:ATP-dependent RNA helicase RhlE
MLFKDLNLIPPLLEAVEALGYEHPTPIQAQAIPHVLAGRDVLGCAQTGTGKTAAFALPILQRLSGEPQHPGRRPIRSLTLAPTRELAAQIDESFHAYGARSGLRHTVIFGGVGQQPQTEALKRGIDILVATPGRLLDLENQGFVDLSHVEVFVLDEADRMLDMGFIPDIRRIVSKLPTVRQTLLFSATLHPTIVDLAGKWLHEPVRVSVTPTATTVDGIEQAVYAVERAEKIPLLLHLLNDQAVGRVLVFTRTKHGADKVERQLRKGGVRAESIHGNKSQRQREQALERFKAGECRVLVATDIASRGLDIDDVTHVVNLDLPNEPDAYVHRIGRTGRAGATGVAYSFCSLEERLLLGQIEKLTKKKLNVIEEHPFRSSVPMMIDAGTSKDAGVANPTIERLLKPGARRPGRPRAFGR